MCRLNSAASRRRIGGAATCRRPQAADGRRRAALPAVPLAPFLAATFGGLLQFEVFCAVFPGAIPPLRRLRPAFRSTASARGRSRVWACRSAWAARPASGNGFRRDDLRRRRRQFGLFRGRSPQRRRRRRRLGCLDFRDGLLVSGASPIGARATSTASSGARIAAGPWTREKQGRMQGENERRAPKVATRRAVTPPATAAQESALGRIAPKKLIFPAPARRAPGRPAGLPLPSCPFGDDGDMGDAVGRQFVQHRDDLAVGGVLVAAQMHDAGRVVAQS